MEQEIKIEFISHGRKAKCPANPQFPGGKDIDATGGMEGLWVDLPYPAKECGIWIVSGPNIMRTAITAAGRTDDPKKVKVPYKEKTE